MPAFRSFWRNLLRRDRVEHELDDEMQATLAALIEEKRSGGASAAAARRAALIELGGVESVKQQVRDVRRGAFADTLLQDVRYAARLLRRNPLFALTAALSMAIGIGATTAIFTVANGLLLRAAPGVTAPGRLVDIGPAGDGRGGFAEPVIPYTDYVALRRRVKTLSAVYGYELQVHPAALDGPDGAERVFVSTVTPDYFTALGVGTAAGRVFTVADGEQEGANRNVVLSHAFWRRRFGGDPGVVGQDVRINGTPLTVRGVAAEAFRGTSVLMPDLWLPAPMSQAVQPGRYSLTNRFSTLQLAVGGRLREGVSRAQAETDLALLTQAMAREYPNEPARRYTVVPSTPIPGSLRTVVAAFLALLMMLVSTLLVIACSNVAAILLARAGARRREFAVRTAIGAARARLTRQLLTETLLLALLGGGAGILLARILTTLLVSLLPAFPLPVHVSVPLDWRVVAFALALSLAGAVLAGLAPALHAARADVVAALKDESQGPSDRMRLRSVFVIVQVAFSVLLVVAAGLFGRALQRTAAIDRGFDPRFVEAISLDLAMAGHTVASGPAFARAMLERVEAIPGVERATIADRIPDGRALVNGSVRLEGPGPDGDDTVPATWNSIEPGYFAVLGIPILAGRDFVAGDHAGGQRVAIVDDRTARRLWPGADPIGKLLEAASLDGGMLRSRGGGRPAASRGERFTIVGVARALPGDTVPGGAPLVAYVPLAQRYTSAITILARAAAGHNVARSITGAIRSMNPSLPVVDARGLDQPASPAQQPLKVAASVAGAVGLVGLLLAAVGVYGITAHAVAQRTREFGIRLSLGARPLDIVGDVMRRGMALVAIGSGIGVVLSVGAGQALARSPLPVAAFDPAATVSAGAAFLLTGAIASYLPVRRATRAQALDALRSE